MCCPSPQIPDVLRRVTQTFAAHETADGGRFEARRIGRVVEGEKRRVFLRKQNLIGEGEEFRPA